MNKSELVEALAAHYEGSRADATRALNAFVQTVSSATAAGERVAITGFGVFERVERPARTVRNPRTGERLDVPATAVPRFRAGTELKAYVSGSRPVPGLPAPATPRTSAPAPVVAAPAEQAAETTIDTSTKKAKSKAGEPKSKAGEPKAKAAKSKAKADKPKGKSDKKSKGKKK